MSTNESEFHRKKDEQRTLRTEYFKGRQVTYAEN